MGYDERRPHDSSGLLVAIIGVGLVLAILAIVAFAGVGLYWVRGSSQQARAIELEQRVIAEAHRAEAEAQRAAALAQLEQARTAAASDTKLDFVLQLDREGNISAVDEAIGLDELKSRLENAKSESSGEFLVRIIADPECPMKNVKPILTVFDDVGGITWNLASPENADAPIGLNNVAD